MELLSEELVEVVVAVDDTEVAFGVGFSPAFRRASGSRGRPLAFDRGERALVFANDVHFGALVGSPEIGVFGSSRKQFLFQNLHKDEIFPERANIVSNGKRLELFDDGVSNAIVEEVVAGFLGDFVAEIAAPPAHALDDEHLLEDIEVALNGFDIGRKGDGYFVERNFVSDLEGEHASDITEKIGRLEAVEREGIFVEIGGDQLFEYVFPCLRVTGVQYFRIGAIAKKRFEVLIDFKSAGVEFSQGNRKEEQSEVASREGFANFGSEIE